MYESELFDEIIRRYSAGEPIKGIARELGVSEVKVRRFLITEGLWMSQTSEEIRKLVQQGYSTEEIADILQKPVKTVQAYMPYSRGEYGSEHMSNSAQNSKKYRERMKSAEEKQVFKRDVKIDMIQFNEWKQQHNFKGEGHKVLKLHLALNCSGLDDKNEYVLKKYGKVKETISRDILVPAEIPLHNLHYAIQRAFGWQNEHLHHFSLPEDVFACMTDDKALTWLDFCGIYFRFPNEEMDDLFWDDDYNGTQSIRTWLRKKYTGPYRYYGLSEHFLEAQEEARIFRENNPSCMVYGGSRVKRLPLSEVSAAQMASCLESDPGELLERLPLSQVIGLDVESGWKNAVSDIREKAKRGFAEKYNGYQRLLREMQKTEIWQNQYSDSEIAALISQYEHTLCSADPKVIPVTDMLNYSYDYGDGWEVKITCVDYFESFDNENKADANGWFIASVTDEAAFAAQNPVDRSGVPVDDPLKSQIATVVSKMRPVCVAADGLPVCDDIGGIDGYCDFLVSIHGMDSESVYDSREESLDWARGQGWTGRMNRPENIL